MSLFSSSQINFDPIQLNNSVDVANFINSKNNCFTYKGLGENSSVIIQLNSVQLE